MFAGNLNVFDHVCGDVLAIRIPRRIDHPFCVSQLHQVGAIAVDPIDAVVIAERHGSAGQRVAAHPVPAPIGTERCNVDELLDGARDQARTVQFCDVRVVLESPFKDHDSGIGVEHRAIITGLRGREKISHRPRKWNWAAAFGTYYLALLAERYEQAEQPEEGLSVVGEALALVDKSGERWWEAELHRLNGLLLLQQIAPDEQQQAETCFQRALEIAKRQRAKSWELRAAMSLSRRWRDQGKHEGARHLLSEIYSWFTEGFETPDLKEARTLLDELTLPRAAAELS